MKTIEITHEALHESQRHIKESFENMKTLPEKTIKKMKQTKKRIEKEFKKYDA